MVVPLSGLSGSLFLEFSDWWSIRPLLQFMLIVPHPGRAATAATGCEWSVSEFSEEFVESGALKLTVPQPCHFFFLFVERRNLFSFAEGEGYLSRHPSCGLSHLACRPSTGDSESLTLLEPRRPQR